MRNNDFNTTKMKKRERSNNNNDKKEMSRHKYYEYEDDTVTCHGCGWSGRGSEAGSGDLWECWYYLDCPKCPKENIASVLLPTDEDIEKFGTAEDKKSLKRRKTFLEKLDATSLKYKNQLPDIDGEDDIVLVWDQILIKSDSEIDEQERYTVIKHNDREIWRQIAAYEGYHGFGDFCRIAKEKYGRRLVDVKPTPWSELYLYGDYLGSVDYVTIVRKSLNED